MWKEFIPIVIVLVLIYFIAKKGGFTTLSNYVYKRKGDRIDMRYKKFIGLEYYRFWLRNIDTFTFHYHVTIEAGSLIVELRNRDKCFFKQEFVSGESGSITYNTNRTLHWVKLKGKNTRGGYHIDITRS